MAYNTKWEPNNPERSVAKAEHAALWNANVPWIGQFAYRFMDQSYSALVDPYESDDYYSYTVVELKAYLIKHETPYGMVIWLNAGAGFVKAETRFVNLDATKTFALPTIEDAIESYVARKDRQARLYEARATKARAMKAIMDPNNPWASNGWSA